MYMYNYVPPGLKGHDLLVMIEHDGMQIFNFYAIIVHNIVHFVH